MARLMEQCSWVLRTSILENINPKNPKRIVCLERAMLEEAEVGSVLIRLYFDKAVFACLFLNCLAIIYVLFTIPADDLLNKTIS